jgi:PleD family two-component response regulator
LSVSLGVVSSPDGAPDSGALLARADGALYRAKAGGKARVVVDTPHQPGMVDVGHGVTDRPR